MIGRSSAKAPNTPERWGKKLTGLLEKYKFVFLVILVGLVLLMLPSFGGGKADEPVIGTADAASSFDVETVEARLEEALSRIEGAGEVKVVLTVRSGARRILAQDGKITEKGEEMDTVIISRGSGLEEAVALQEVAPQFQGALVVCPGGDDPEVRLKLSEAVSDLTGLGADKISVCKGGG